MDITARITRNDLDGLPADFAATVLAAVTARAAAKAAAQARHYAPKATSTLAQSIIARKLNDREWEVTAGQRYAAGLEAGGGHKGEELTSPRLAALEAWVKAKGIESSPLAIARAAWNIGKHVQAHGVKQQEFMRPARDDAASGVVQDLKQELKRAR